MVDTTPDHNSEQLPAIVLIDDVPMVLDLLADMLEDIGHPVVCLESGATIVEFLDEHPVAVVFCDVELPKMNGVEVLRMIKQHTPETQVIMISGGQDFDIARQVLRERALDYLSKPFVPHEVLEAARLGLSSYYHARQQKEARHEAERRMTDLVLLRKVSETTSTGGDLQSLFDHILNAIVESAGVEVASLMLLDDEGALRIVSATGLDSDILERVRVTSGDGVSGHVVASGEPVLVEDIERDPRFSGFGAAAGGRYKDQSLLSVPIFIRDKLVGVINVNNKVTGEPFDQEDQRLLLTIATQVALAMENFDLVNNLRRQAQELTRSNEDLMRMHQAQARLVCNLSHELKTPLTSIIGYADLCLSFFDKLSATDLKENLAHVCEEGGRLERLINGMLRLFSIESKRETWHWTSFTLPWSCADTFQYYNEKIEALGLVVDVDIADDLPEVYADQEKFGMAVSALIDNAVKFNRPGGRLVVRATKQQKAGLDYIYVQIHNDGSVIPASAIDIIFNSYTQLGNIDTEKPHGVGIGLALVKAVIDRMLGKIFLEEVTGKGTCFGLLLPTEETYHQLKRDL